MQTNTTSGGGKIVLLIAFLGSLVLAGRFGALRAISPQTAAAPSQSATLRDGVYSEAQARRGENVFKAQCSYCHKDNLSGGFLDDGVGHAPALAGKQAFESSFAERWGGLTLADLVATVAATMPQQRPSSLSVQEYVDVACYLLFKNAVPTGASDLPADVETLGRIIIPEN